MYEPNPNEIPYNNGSIIQGLPIALILIFITKKIVNKAIKIESITIIV